MSVQITNHSKYYKSTSWVDCNQLVVAGKKLVLEYVILIKPTMFDIMFQLLEEQKSDKLQGCKISANSREKIIIVEFTKISSKMELDCVLDEIPGILEGIELAGSKLQSFAADVVFQKVLKYEIKRVMRRIVRSGD